LGTFRAPVRTLAAFSESVADACWPVVLVTVTLIDNVPRVSGMIGRMP